MSKKGFTLIEMVLALGITALLLRMVIPFIIDVDKFIITSKNTMSYYKEVDTLERIINEDIINNIDKINISEISNVLIIGDNALSIKRSLGDDIKYSIVSNKLVRTEGIYSEVLIEKITAFNCSYIDDILKINMSIENSDVNIDVKIINDFWDYKKVFPN